MDFQKIGGARISGSANAQEAWCHREVVDLKPWLWLWRSLRQEGSRPPLLTSDWPFLRTPYRSEAVEHMVAEVADPA